MASFGKTQDTNFGYVLTHCKSSDIY